jgi:hypothetical protein
LFICQIEKRDICKQKRKITITVGFSQVIPAAEGGGEGDG